VWPLTMVTELAGGLLSAWCTGQPGYKLDQASEGTGMHWTCNSQPKRKKTPNNCPYACANLVTMVAGHQSGRLPASQCSVVYLLEPRHVLCAVFSLLCVDLS
jgi:hypothetical protein